jgi:hypothetical protein
MPSMKRVINLLMLGALTVFVVGAVAIAAYQFAYVIPAKNCEGAGKWWDPQSRSCATPIYIPHITGRPVDTQEAARAAAAGLAEAEAKSPKSVVDPRPSF